MLLIVAAAGLTIGLTACSQNEEPKSADKEKEVVEQSGKDEETESEKQTEDKMAIASNEFFEPFNGKIDHIHGVGYAGDQGAPFYAAHDGLKVFEDGKWFKTKKQNNDYMGFNATQDGFYSSGHPGEDSDLPNPIGIQKSTDNGQTLESLVLEGEIDFHIMGVGYENKAIFVQNPHGNSLMEAEKFYLSENNTDTWQEMNANGLQDEIISVAVHPQKTDYLAAAGQQGIYLSEDKGSHFEKITNGGQGTSVFFTNESLIYGSYQDGTPRLVKLSLDDGVETEIPLPKMKEDAVMYFAQNPKNKQEMTFTTFNGNIFFTEDGGSSWDLMVEAGNLK
ncbi:F510_1955 family glycosylhydrolase [Cytobacillus sp. NCCP-133]|uniref:F510_1955 family glycosylhydrolase n=1 Tax=Cytobacillus sp. NCCP-133 TaxID=766848 RepID=UPI00222FE002|nr:hypothetical protein [Cytobacillus sp. NCCP-133]